MKIFTFIEESILFGGDDSRRSIWTLLLHSEAFSDNYVSSCGAKFAYSSAFKCGYIYSSIFLTR